jgi:hypothetical protein
MTDSYWAIASIADDIDMRKRMYACAVQQSKLGLYFDRSPELWVSENVYVWASSPGWGEAWESAVASNNEAPGRDPSVITDGMILSTVQDLTS